MFNDYYAEEMQAEYNAYHDYIQEAYGPTALDAAHFAVIDNIAMDLEGGFITEEEASFWFFWMNQ